MVDINKNEKPERATTGNKKQQRAAKSNEKQQKAKTNMVGEKTKTGNKKPKRATKGTKGPHENQAFEIELILSQKQERATKSSKKQLLANGNTPQKPTRATTSNKKHQRAFFTPIFIHFLQVLTYGRWLTSRAMKNQKDQQGATKSSKKQ